VPRLAALSKDGARGPSAEVNSVSCASPGNCAAGGDYPERHGHLQALTAVKRDGQ